MPLKPKEFMKILRDNGFILKSSNGSHYKFVHPISGRIVIVPYHNKDLKRSLESQLFKDSGLKRR